MIRTLILLLPVYVSLFWVVSLLSNKKNISAPSRFLSFFMFVNAVCFFGQYLFFAPHHDIFPYWEPFLAYFGSIAFPIYYIYFRLLTVDDKFEFRKHAKYLIVPVLIATVYTVGILSTPFEQYKAWLYDDSLYPDSTSIQFLGIMRNIVKLTFVVLLVITYILNRRLIKKYAHKAEQYYSDIQDGKFSSAKILNYFLVFISVSTFLAHAIGRRLLFPSELIIEVIWMIFAVSLYGIGYIGFTQKPINPTYEPVFNGNENDIVISNVEEMNFSQKLILQKLIYEFENEKVYLSSCLNIMDVVQKVGSNRTYISSIINQNFNQNFCSFVNGYRLSEMEKLFLQNNSLSNEILAEKSGFGSVNSMKRAISTKFDCSIAEWKQQAVNLNKNKLD